MRIIFGKYGSRVINSPKTVTRPTTDRVRESLFNTLLNITNFEGANILDLFAGSGALGLESLSLGAKFCTFNDSMASARQIIKNNCKSLEISNFSYSIEAFNALKPQCYLKLASSISKSDRKYYDIIFLDPPYIFKTDDIIIIFKCLIECGLISEGSIIALEAAKYHLFDYSLLKSWQISEIRQKSYGNSVVQLFKTA